MVDSPIGAHNAYKRKFLPSKVTVYYPFHPAYPRELMVVEKRDFKNDQFYLVQFLDKIIYLPTWMTDAGCCQTISVEAPPRCSVEALCQLCRLLDGLAF